MQIRKKLRCIETNQGFAVSRWHSLPQGTGTFPTAWQGASSPFVRCEAVLPLPPSALLELASELVAVFVFALVEVRYGG